MESDSGCVKWIVVQRQVDYCLNFTESDPIGGRLTAVDPMTTSQPVDAIIERLNDPGVAASMVTLLDNAELFSTLAMAFGTLLERGDSIMETVADSVNELKSGGDFADGELPSIAEVKQMTAQVRQATPVLEAFVQSPMANVKTVDILGLFAAAATEGTENAKASKTAVTGVRSALRSMKDPDVQRGLGLLVEISKALGKNLP